MTPRYTLDGAKRPSTHGNIGIQSCGTGLRKQRRGGHAKRDRERDKDDRDHHDGDLYV